MSGFKIVAAKATEDQLEYLARALGSRSPEQWQRYKSTQGADHLRWQARIAFARLIDDAPAHELDGAVEKLIAASQEVLRHLDEDDASLELREPLRSALAPFKGER